MDPNGGIRVANLHGEQDGWYNPDQYSNPTVSSIFPLLSTGSHKILQNYEAHIRWTGPQIMKQLPKLSVFTATIGTTGRTSPS